MTRETWLTCFGLLYCERKQIGKYTINMLEKEQIENWLKPSLEINHKQQRKYKKAIKELLKEEPK